MNKPLCLIAFLLVFPLLFFSCAPIAEVNVQTIDKRFEPGHYETKTDYVYKVDLLGDETFKLLPNVSTVWIEDQYFVEYEIFYENGATKTEWKSVTKEEYEAAVVEK